MIWVMIYIYIYLFMHVLLICSFIHLFMYCLFIYCLFIVDLFVVCSFICLLIDCLFKCVYVYSHFNMFKYANTYIYMHLFIYISIEVHILYYIHIYVFKCIQLYSDKYERTRLHVQVWMPFMFSHVHKGPLQIPSLPLSSGLRQPLRLFCKFRFEDVSNHHGTWWLKALNWFC